MLFKQKGLVWFPEDTTQASRFWEKWVSTVREIKTLFGIHAMSRSQNKALQKTTVSQWKFPFFDARKPGQWRKLTPKSRGESNSFFLESTHFIQSSCIFFWNSRKLLPKFCRKNSKNQLFHLCRERMNYSEDKIGFTEQIYKPLTSSKKPCLLLLKTSERTQLNKQKQKTKPEGRFQPATSSPPNHIDLVSFCYPRRHVVCNHQIGKFRIRSKLHHVKEKRTRVRSCQFSTAPLQWLPSLYKTQQERFIHQTLAKPNSTAETISKVPEEPTQIVSLCCSVTHFFAEPSITKHLGFC